MAAICWTMKIQKESTLHLVLRLKTLTGETIITLDIEVSARTTEVHAETLGVGVPCCNGGIALGS